MSHIKIFVGSSTSAIKITGAIQSALAGDAEVIPWNQGVFQLSNDTLEDLLRILKEVDFAIFVFSPADLVIINGSTIIDTVRDNVIFETGLFTGHLGRERVMYLKPDEQEVKLPSDLAGKKYGKYYSHYDNKIAAVGQFCSEVRERLAELGEFPGKKQFSKNSFEELHHINLPVRDLDRSIAFYKDFLGLPLIERPEVFPFPGRWFGLPTRQNLHLVLKPDGTYRERELIVNGDTPPDIHFALRVSYERFYQIDTGLTLLPEYVSISQPFPGLKQLYILDPDNHIVEITALSEQQLLMKPI